MSIASRFFDEERDAYVLGVLRVAVGVLLTIQTGQRLVELGREGYFGDVFHLPIVPEALVPSALVYVALQLAALAGGVLAVAGFRARAGLLVSAAVGLFLLFANRLDYHNNRFALLLLALLTAFTPCDRSLVLVRGRAHTLAPPARVGPTFATRLIRLTVSAVYLSSGGGKLLDADWRGGQTMLVRFTRSLEQMSEQHVAVPEPLVLLYSSPAVASVVSKAAITLELVLAVALWLPKLRPLALYLGVLFHLNIELSARVELFSYVMGAAYLAFVVPEVRERVVELDPGSVGGRLLKKLLPLLDWLARFRVEERVGAPFAVLGRDGRRHVGVAALAALSRATPALFPLWLPLAAAARLVGRGRGASSGSLLE